MAASPEELLGQINGSRAKNITLNTSQAGIEQFGVPLNLRRLKALSRSHPGRGILMLVGLYALIFGPVPARARSRRLWAWWPWPWG